MGCFFSSRRARQTLYLGIYFNIVQGLIDPEKDNDKLAPDPPGDIADDEHDQSSQESASAQQAEGTKAASSQFPKSFMTAPAEHSGKAGKGDQHGNHRVDDLNNLQSDHGTEG